jgi:hypothetical protein
LLAEFTATCSERGIGCETALVTGIIANEICDHARTSDLVIIGHRGANERFSTGLFKSFRKGKEEKDKKRFF